MLLPIVFQDADLVVIDKPAGLPLHALAEGDLYPASALRAAQAQSGLAYLGTPQRLDAGASGVVSCVTRRDLIKPLAASLAARGAEQVFLALVHGAPPAAQGKIEAPLAREGDGYVVTTPRDKHATPSVTRYRALETAPGGRYSLLEVAAERGPGAEQVCPHLAHLGMPVVGDHASGSGKDGGASHVHPVHSRAPRTPEQPRAGWDHAPRLGLHLLRITLQHPVTGQNVTFAASPPALFDRVATGLPELGLAASIRHVRRIKGGVPGLAELIDLAAARRTGLAADPDTTIYRLVNGAADGLPGLTADRYGEALVVNVYDESPHPEPPAPALLSALGRAAGVTAVYVKHRQREASQVDEGALPALAPGRPAAGSALGEFATLEDGLRYLVRPGEGWNPGIFPDMREMRGRVRAWAAGKRVLNCFAYTCAFGVAAAAGRAARVANLDVSAPALERGAANYRLNGIEPREDDFLYGDAFDWLQRLAQRRESFDIVILDPPGFARTKQHVWSAAQNYGKLAQLAAAVTAPGGLLVACCNVADLSWSSFEAKVMGGLDEAWRARDVFGRYAAPAIDFPVEPGRESYLKVLVSRLA